MKNELNKELLKISQLAKATGTNITTLKYYVKEGLLQPECKTTKNMAYYNKDCIKRVNMIRSLQKEHYYPLAVIKGLIDNIADPFELEFMDAIHKADLKDSGKQYTLTEASKLTGLSKAQIDHLKNMGIISICDDVSKSCYSYSDVHIMRLAKRRLDVGIPFEQSVKAFMIYQEALKNAASLDVDCFISKALLAESPSAQQSARMIVISDETLDSFVSIKRNQLNRMFGSERIDQLYHFAHRLAEYIDACISIFQEKGYSNLSGKLISAKTGYANEKNLFDNALTYYSLVMCNATKSLTKSISLINNAQKFFLFVKTDRVTEPEDLAVYALKLGWLCLSPSLLGNGESDKTLKSSFIELSERHIDNGADIAKKIIYALENIK